MKTRKDELQDLFIAVRKHLLNCGNIFKRQKQVHPSL